VARGAVFVALLLIAATAWGCGDDDDDPGAVEDERSDEQVVREIRDDLEGLADALAAGNYDRVYTDFLSSDCQGLVSQQAYVQTLERSRQQLEAQRVQIDDVVLLSRQGPDEAEVRVDFTLLRDGEPVPRDPEQTPSIEVVVFEDGHWRSRECFGLEFAPTATP
jgi:hypothetical protein